MKLRTCSERDHWPAASDKHRDDAVPHGYVHLMDLCRRGMLDEAEAWLAAGHSFDCLMWRMPVKNPFSGNFIDKPKMRAWVGFHEAELRDRLLAQ
jgi:hypothetical protein